MIDDIYNSDVSTPDYDSGVLDAYGSGFEVGDGQTSIPAGSMNDWGSWARNIAGSVVTGAVDMYKYRTISGQGGIPAVAPNGSVYAEGQRVKNMGIPVASIGGIQITSGMVLMGAAVAAFLILKK